MPEELYDRLSNVTDVCMYVCIAQFTRDYWCASELELRLEGFDRSVTRKTVVQLRRHCTLIWGRWGEGEKWEGRGGMI